MNRRFAVAPRNPEDAHRPLRAADDLNRILAVRELRTLSKNLTLSYNSVVYQIQTGRPAYALRHAQVHPEPRRRMEVRERWDGRLAILYKGKSLEHTVYREPPRQALLITSKMVNPELDARFAAKKKRKVYVPSPDHPWRKFHYGKGSDQPAHGREG